MKAAFIRQGHSMAPFNWARKCWDDTMIVKEASERFVVTWIEPVIFRFHRKPKRNLFFETELPVSTYL